MKRSDLLSLKYYDKASFTGSENGTRYKVSKTESEKGHLLTAWVWPEPFSFDNTKDAVKTFQTFEYSEEGLTLAAKWINEKIC